MAIDKKKTFIPSLGGFKRGFPAIGDPAFPRNGRALSRLLTLLLPCMNSGDMRAVEWALDICSLLMTVPLVHRDRLVWYGVYGHHFTRDPDRSVLEVLYKTLENKEIWPGKTVEMHATDPNTGKTTRHLYQVDLEIKHADTIVMKSRERKKTDLPLEEQKEFRSNYLKYWRALRWLSKRLTSMGRENTLFGEHQKKRLETLAPVDTHDNLMLK